MWMARRFLQVMVAAGMLVGVFVASNGGEDQGPAETATLRDGFEVGQTVWQREYSDTTVNVLAQDRSERAAHGGRLSEHFRFNAGQGSQFFVSYALPRIPVSAELTASLYVALDTCRSSDLRASGLTGGCRPGDEGAIVCSGTRDNFRPDRSLAADRAGGDAAND